MSVRQVLPPEPIVEASEVPHDSGVSDLMVEAAIAAATEEIDGPMGWVGRCFGPQTLELTLDFWGDRAVKLPCPPLIRIVSVAYLDTSFLPQTINAANYVRTAHGLRFIPSWSAPSLANAPGVVTIRYEAGYNGTTNPPAGGINTGAVPARVKQAVILAAQDILRSGVASGGVRSIATQDVETITYLDGDKISAMVRNASERLLAGLRIYSL